MARPGRGDGDHWTARTPVRAPVCVSDGAEPATTAWAVRWSELPDEQRGENEGYCGQQLHQDVERRAGGVLEGVADGVADDGRGVGIRTLAEQLAVVVLEVARLDVLLGVVPRAAAVVQHR